MTEFKLCEEMGLKTLEHSWINDSFKFHVILALDVEKMLQGGRRYSEQAEWQSGPIRGPFQTYLGEKTEHISLTIPQKPKPVTKEDILQALKTLNVLHNKFDHVTDLIERIEKNGIE